MKKKHFCVPFGHDGKRESECCKSDENRRAIGMVTLCTIITKSAAVQGEIKNISLTTACTEDWKVKLIIKTQLLYTLKAFVLLYRYLLRKFSPPLDFSEVLLRVGSNLRLGSRRDEEFVDEVPVLAVLIVASQKVCVLFLRPPALICPLFPSVLKPGMEGE